MLSWMHDAARLRAENDELRSQVESQSKLIADLMKVKAHGLIESGFLSRALDQAREAVEMLGDAIESADNVRAVLAREKVRP